MSKYTEASNRSYGEWLARESVLRGIPPAEIEKQIEVKDFRFWVSKGGLGREDPVMGARLEFDRVCSEFDVVVNFIEGTLQAVVTMSGTGIRWMKK